jgi:AraC-like DNA-binding protein
MIISKNPLTTSPNRVTVPGNENKSFDLRHECLPYFPNSWHFHPELELNFIVASSGMRFIGNSMERFAPGDIVLLGKNLPHYWKNDPAYFQADNRQPAEAIVVRFPEDFAGNDFLRLPETQAIRNLFERAFCGLKLLEPLRSKIAKQLHQLAQAEGFEQLLSLLRMLHEIAYCDAVETISPDYRLSKHLTNQNSRLSKVITYLVAHFTEPISLGYVANLASMNQAAFCRYFKAQSGQTLTQYLTEQRIRYACELLHKGQYSVTDVCYKVGFENVSHFIQAFKKKRHQTPFEFKKQSTH